MYINFLRRKAGFRLLQWKRSIDHTDNTPAESNVVLVTVKHELATTQIYPFYFYRNILKKKHSIRFTEIDVEDVIASFNTKSTGSKNTHLQVKRVFVQTPFQIPFQIKPESLTNILSELARTYPNAKIAFMDWFAPLDIRPAMYVDRYIDMYIKKQVFKDYKKFSEPTIGDTNLNNYFALRHKLTDPPMQYTLPDRFEKKLRIGSNFNLSPQMVDLFLGNPPEQSGRDIDLHARIAVSGVPWYQAMRQEAKDSVKKLRNLNIVSEGRVRRHRFFDEMKRSKICFSPFGYGEVCWRDYEAFATGALLFKPDMGHLEVFPETFIPYETYVPLRWDLEDFEDKVHEYLAKPLLRSEICERAFTRMRDSIKREDAAIQIANWCGPSL